MVYFSEPLSTHIDTIYTFGQGPIEYHMYIALSLEEPVETNYRARLKYPNGNWSDWMMGKNGGWWVTEPGTYQIEGKVWTKNKVTNSPYKWFYREAFSFSVIELPVPQPVSMVTIGGDEALNVGETGYWLANLTDGISPFTFHWQIMYLENNYMKVNVNGSISKFEINYSDGIIINAPPSNYWTPVGDNLATFNRTITSADLRDFKLRCIVTDGSNTTVTSNEWYISILSILSSQTKNDKLPLNNQKIQFNENISINSIPDEYKLNQNYPNPFNPTTIIEYQIPNDAFVSLKIFDILGEEVNTLVNEIKSKGRYSISFNASNLTSGIYFYRLKTDNYTAVNKMILSK